MKRFSRAGRWQRTGAALTLTCVWACTPSLRAAAPRQSVEPDYTKGEKLEGDLKYEALGPIGAFGNLWGTGAHDATRQTRMTLASYGQRELGHTGNFFSWQWGALGAARGGPEAAQSFVRNTRWFTELERRPDGGSVYQNQLASSEHGKYKNWSTTGSRLLQHCLPRKALHITGKGGSSVPPITGDDLKAVVAAGAFNPAPVTVKELLAALGNRSMIVREQAARELGKRDEDVVMDLVAMLDNPDRHARYGACVGLEFAGRKSAAAVDAMMRKLETDGDLTMRFFAANSLKLSRKDEKPNGLGTAVLKTAHLFNV